MEYKLESFVWEFTMGCNMRCRHCASACKERLPDELTTEESLALVDDIALLKPKWMSFSGGEPLLRDDWYEIAKKIQSYGIDVRMITNGSLINEDCVQRMKDAGMSIISVSMDGTREIYNYIRGGDFYSLAENALSLLGKAGIASGSNTTVIKENIDNLPELRNELVRMGVRSWQIQPGLPDGNLAENRESILEPDDFLKLIDFAYEENKKGDIYVALAEDIGYYTRKEIITRKAALQSDKLPVWDGCNAGIRSLGISHNGDITGCTSIRRKGFIEGNVRSRRVSDIWTDENSFAWRRQLSQDKLKGFCKTCIYKNCLGGCSNVRLTMHDDLFAENKYCVYNLQKNISA